MLARAIAIFVLIFLSGMAAGVSVSALIASRYLVEFPEHAITGQLHTYGKKLFIYSDKHWMLLQ